MGDIACIFIRRLLPWQLLLWLLPLSGKSIEYLILQLWTFFRLCWKNLGCTPPRTLV